MKRLFTVSLLLCLVLCLTSCEWQHEWSAATCTTPKTCTLCGETEGIARGHEWHNANCTVPKTCAICGTTQGTVAPHSVRIGTCPDCGLKSTVLKAEADKISKAVNDIIKTTTDSAEYLLDSYDFLTVDFQKTYVELALNEFNTLMIPISTITNTSKDIPEFLEINKTLYEMLKIMAEVELTGAYDVVRDNMIKMYTDISPYLEEMTKIIYEW